MKRQSVVLALVLFLGLVSLAGAQDRPPQRPEPSQGNPLVGDLKKLWETGTVKSLTVTLGASALVSQAAATSVVTDKLPLITVDEGNTKAEFDASAALGFVFHPDTGSLDLILR